MKDFDVIVVGGGPVGLYAAGLCERMGYRVCVIEEHRKIGEPLHCSGLISRNIERFVKGIGEMGSIVENRVDSARIHSPMSEFVLKKKGVGAYVINRTGLDRHLYEQLNSKVFLGTRVDDFEIGKGVSLKTRKGTFSSEIVLGCDGADSVFSDKVGFRPKELIGGIFGIEGKGNRSGEVDIYFDKDVLSDGFFWKIPRGKTTEYGALGKGVNFHYLKRYFGKGFRRRHGGLIPMGFSGKSYSERVILIGNSAGQVKPWSGGGVVYGMTCADIASKTVEKAFRFNDFSEDLLKVYERGWKGKIGMQIGLGMAFRSFMKRSGNFQMDMAFRMLNILPMNWMDMDFIFSKPV